MHLYSYLNAIVHAIYSVIMGDTDLQASMRFVGMPASFSSSLPLLFTSCIIEELVEGIGGRNWKNSATFGENLVVEGELVDRSKVYESVLAIACLHKASLGLAKRT
jgi:hypothetical protein